MKFNRNFLGYRMRFSLGCVGDRKRKVEHQGTLRLVLPQKTTKGVGKESWKSLVQPQLKPGSSPTLHPVSDGFVWPGRENLQGWKFLSI